MKNLKTLTEPFVPTHVVRKGRGLMRYLVITTQDKYKIDNTMVDKFITQDEALVGVFTPRLIKAINNGTKFAPVKIINQYGLNFITA